MNLEFTDTGFARHPVSFNLICEHIKYPERYEEGVFNTDLVNLIGEWSKESETKETKSRLLILGLGSIGAASVVSYETIDEKLEILEIIEEKVPSRPTTQEIIKTKRGSMSGLIFHTEGDYSDGKNVGVWIPESSTKQLIIQVFVSLKTTKKPVY